MGKLVENEHLKAYEMITVILSSFNDNWYIMECRSRPGYGENFGTNRSTDQDYFDQAMSIIMPDNGPKEEEDEADGKKQPAL